jgi:hypothetical protein
MKVCAIAPPLDPAKPNRIPVLGMPFGPVDTYNTYFSERTQVLEEYMPHLRLPAVFNYHGLDGTSHASLPVGQTIDTWVDESGRWYLAEFYENHPDTPMFIEAARKCNLYASVGMLRAAMFPKPPAVTRGVFPQPTELLIAPVAELSVIVGDPQTGRLPANYYAQAGYAFVDDSASDAYSRARVVAKSARFTAWQFTRRKQMLTQEQLAQLATSLGAAAAMLNTAVAASVDGVSDHKIDLTDDVRAALEAASAPLKAQATEAKAEADELRRQLGIVIGKQNDDAVNAAIDCGLIDKDGGDALRAVLNELPAERNADLRDLVSAMSDNMRSAAQAVAEAQSKAIDNGGADDAASQRAAAFVRQMAKAGDDIDAAKKVREAGATGNKVDAKAMDQYRARFIAKGLPQNGKK